MHAALMIARNDLRLRIRDRSALVIGIVAPLVIAALMSLAFRGAENFHFTMAVVDEDQGPIAAQLVQALRSPQLSPFVTIRPLPTPAAAHDAITSRSAAAALIIPSGFSAAAAGAHPRGLQVLTSVNNTIAGNLTTSIASSFAAQLNADRLSVATALAAGVPAGRTAELTSAAASLRIPEQVVQTSIGAHPLTPISYYGPAMAIFFLLFNVSFTARSFFVDRDNGMIERMLAAPVRPATVLAGKALSVLVFGTVSLGVIALVTTVAFGADWGDPLAVALLCLALVASVVAVTALVIGLSRTQRQAEGFASLAVFGLALLGGNFVLLATAPPLMRQLSLFTPNGWALRGITDLTTRGGGVGAVALPIGAILLFTAVVGGIAAGLARRSVTT